MFLTSRSQLIENDYSKHLKLIEDRFRDKSYLYLATNKSFFFSKCFPILLNRSGGRVIFDKEDIWGKLEAILLNLLFQRPENFIRYTEFPYIDALLSLKHLRTNMDVCSGLTWIDGNSAFIDSSGSEGLIGHGVKLCVLNNIQSLRETFRECEQYRMKDVILAMTELFCFTSETFGNDWEAKIAQKAIKREEMREKYFLFLSKIWTPRQLAKAYRETKPSSYDTLSLSRWEQLVRWEVALHLRKKGAETHLEASALLYHADEESRDKFVTPIAENIYARIENLRRRFQTRPASINKLLSRTLHDHLKSSKLDSPTFNQPRRMVFEELQSLSRMRISHKTKAIYKSLLVYDGMMRMERADHRGIYTIHTAASHLKINPNETRNLIIKLYPETLWNGVISTVFHDRLYSVIPSIVQLLRLIPKQSKPSKSLNKMVKLITSCLASGGIDVQLIDGLSQAAKKIDRVKPEAFSNLEELYNQLCFSQEDLNTVFALAGKLNINLSAEEDSAVARNMRLTSKLKSLLDKVREPLAPPIRQPIHKTLGPLSISVLPHNHLLGMMGAGVSGVCISYGSKYHMEHLSPSCQNLIVHDGQRILLWGLLVESECGKLYLNNFQGSLPSRYQKFKGDLVAIIQKILAKVGDVFLLDFYFNALSITGQLPIAPNPGLKLPYMRLDIDQTDDGHLVVDELYFIKGHNPT